MTPLISVVCIGKYCSGAWMEWYNVLWARFSFLFLSSCSLSTRVFFFFFFNVCNPLLRCCWPWNATKSCQCFFWFSGRQQSKHKHSIINKREWLTGQARRISPQQCFQSGKLFNWTCPALYHSKALDCSIANLRSPLMTQGAHPGERPEGVSPTHPAVFMFLLWLSERLLRRRIKGWEFLYLGYLTY